MVQSPRKTCEEYFVSVYFIIFALIVAFTSYSSRSFSVPNPNNTTFLAILRALPVFLIPQNPLNTPWAYIRTKGKFIFGRLIYRGTYICEEKHFSLKSETYFLFLNLLFFSSIKHVFRHFSRRARCGICSKITKRHQNI